MIDGAKLLHDALTPIGIPVTPIPNKQVTPYALYEQSYEELEQSGNCEITTTKQTFAVTIFTDTLGERQALKYELIEALNESNRLEGNFLFLESIQFDVISRSQDKFIYTTIYTIIITD